MLMLMLVLTLMCVFMRMLMVVLMFHVYVDVDANGVVDPNGAMRAVNLNGMVPYGGTAVVSTTADHGIDGGDNNSNGVIDEESERDTSPPYRYAIPAIQIKLRVQDATAGTLQELSMVHSLQGN